MNAIDREAAADAIHKANMEALNTPGNWMAAGRSLGLTIAENIIRNMPAVEVEPVRHSRMCKKYICPVNGAPCNECKPGAPCAVQKREE